jgi:DNA-directed RNA polymerase I subunit RPA2
VAPHVESYNYFVALGMNEALEDLPVNEMMPEEGQHIQMHYTGVNIANPQKNDEHSTSKLTPREARERGLSYSGLMMGIVKITLDDGTDINISVKFGEMPVMVASERCCLNGLNARQLVAMREESNEAGGYFIVNGIERVIRLLQVPRRNHAMALERSSFKNRGAYYSDKGVSMRCVRRDQTSITITLHYLTNGGATLRFVLRKQEFLLPIVMVARALRDISDKELFDRIVGGDTENTFLTARLELILRDSKRYNMFTSAECRAYLGTLFRNSLPISDKTSDEDAGRLLLERFIFVHLDDFGAKQECLIFMIRKLFSFAQGNCAADNADALMNHEILLPGHLLTMIVKEKLEEAMLAVRQAINYDFRTKKESRLADIRSAKYYQRLFDRVTTSVGSKVLSFLSTGNITSSSGLDLMQVSGYTIVAERLNALRFMSHFQSVHRGQFFTTMKTTAVRKLLPESWGFLCPVHTPDGGPCGLLNHMARDAVILAFPANVRLPSTSAGRLNSTSAVGNKSGESDASEWVDEVGLRRLLVSLGVTVAGVGNGDGQLILPNDYITVMIDGDVLGGVHHSEASDIVKQLRLLKVNGIKGTDMKVDPTMEVAYIPPSANKGGAYPGIYIFTQPGRFIRPVLHLDQKQVEWVGPMEQVFMNIACLSQDIRNDTSHIELMPTAMLSQIAALTPFSDYNQSPRNMYQCQMGKQTMGTPAHALKHRNDNKLYRIQNVQAPLVQTKAHREYCMDEYPQGVNAVVAVISYTGFDMEDAMIINKAAYERGFGHGSVYKTQVIDLDEEEKNSSKMGIRPKLKFSNQRKQFVVLQDEKNDEKMSAEKKKLKQAEGADMYEDSEGKPIMTDKFCPRLDYDGLPPEGMYACVHLLSQYGIPGIATREMICTCTYIHLHIYTYVCMFIYIYIYIYIHLSMISPHFRTCISR